MHSLVKLLSLYRGLKFTLIAPAGLELPAHLADRISRNGHVVVQTAPLADGLAGADVVYATRIQKKRFEPKEQDGIPVRVALFAVLLAVEDRCRARCATPAGARPRRSAPDDAAVDALEA